MDSTRPLKPRPTGECPPGQELQINSVTMEEVCAPPGSTPHYLADADQWVMVPNNWILEPDPETGRLRYYPPPQQGET